MPRRILLLVVLLTGLLGISTGQVLAQGPSTTLSLEIPETGELTEEITLTATLLTEDGTPVSGATIIFFTPAEFAGVLGDMELGSRVTSTQGVAIRTFEPRRTGTIEIIARFSGDSRYGASDARAPISLTGSEQLYVQAAGLRIPFVGVSLLAGALGLVLGLYVVVGGLVYAIAKDGHPADVGRELEA